MKQMYKFLALALLILSIVTIATGVAFSVSYDQNGNIIYDDFDLNQYSQPKVSNEFAVEQQQVAEQNVYNQFNVEQQQPAPSIDNTFRVEQQAAPQRQQTTNTFAAEQQIAPTRVQNQDSITVTQTTQPTVREPQNQFTVEQQDPPAQQQVPTQFVVQQQINQQPVQQQNQFTVEQQQAPAQLVRPQRNQEQFVIVQQQPSTVGSSPNNFVVVQQANEPAPPQQQTQTNSETFVVTQQDNTVSQPQQNPEQIVIIRTDSQPPQTRNDGDIVVVQTADQPTNQVVTNEYDIYADTRYIDIYACYPYTERLVVYNRGNIDQTFTISVENDELASWTTISPSYVTIPAEEGQEVLVTINTPCNEQGSRDYKVIVETDEVEKSFTRTLTVFLQQNLDVVMYDVNRTSCPCEKQVYNYTISNTGTFTETYTLFADNYEKYVKLGKNQITLAPNQTYSSSVNVTFPCDHYGERDFKVSFETEKTGLIGYVPISYEINACYEFSLVIPQMNVCNNGYGEQDLVITSLSNVTLNLDLDMDLPDFVSVPYNSIALPPKGNVTIPVKVNPTNEKEKVYKYQITASENIANYKAVADSNITIEACYEYNVQTSYETYDICNINHYIPFHLENKGEFAENFIVSAQVGEEFAHAVSLDMNNVTLQNNESAWFTLYVNGSNLPANEKIPVAIATDFTTSAKMDAEKTIYLQTRDYEYCYGIELSHTKLTTNNTPQQQNIGVTNNGILNTTYYLTSDDPQWATLLNTSISLAPGETKDISYFFAPNTSVQNISYPMSFNADANNIRQQKTLEVDVNPSNKWFWITLGIVAALLILLLLLTFLPTLIPFIIIGSIIAGILLIPFGDWIPQGTNETTNQTQTTYLEDNTTEDIGGSQTTNITQNTTVKENETTAQDNQTPEETPTTIINTTTIVYYCAQDTFTCDDGSIVARNPDNRCEFYECPTDPFSWFKGWFADKNESVCPADTFECARGAYVVRNPNNNCEFYACPGDTYYYNETIYVTVSNSTDTVYYTNPTFLEQVTNWFSSSNNTCAMDMFECAPGIYATRDPANSCNYYACPGDVYYYNNTITLNYTDDAISSEDDLRRFVEALEPESFVIYIEPNTTKKLELRGYFEDPDGDNLTYTINTTNVENYVFIMEGDYLTVIPNSGYTGVEVITITANDGELRTTSPNLYLATVPKEWWPAENTESNLDSRMIIALIIVLVIIFAIIIYMDVAMLKKNAK